MLTPEALRERAIILYEHLEHLDDGKIDAILAAFTALIAEARRQAEASRRVPALDNHHNALACGYCAGPLKEENVRLAALVTDADRRVAEAQKDHEGLAWSLGQARDTLASLGCAHGQAPFSTRVGQEPHVTTPPMMYQEWINCVVAHRVAEARRAVKLIIDRHRHHVQDSPGAGSEQQRYALATLGDLEMDLQIAGLSDAAALRAQEPA